MLKSISAAITGIPTVEVKADTSEVTEAAAEVAELTPEPVKVDVTVDTSEVEQAAKEAEKAVKDIPSPQIDTSAAESELSELEQKIAVLKKALEMLSATDEALLNSDGEYKDANAAMKDYTRLEKIDTVKAKLEELEAKKRELEKSVSIVVEVDADPKPINKTKDSIDNVGKGAKKTSEEVSEAFKKASKNAGSSVNGSCDDILKTMSSMLGKVKGLVAAAGISFGVKEIIAFGRQALESAAQVNAANSQLTQTFGIMQQSAEGAIERVAEQSGILETRLRSTGTSIYAFAKTSGMDSSQALNMMDEALQVAADSAAYYDRSLEDTSETLKSFLKGNYANDAALGLSATEYTRNAAAMKLYGKSFQDLSEAQKQLTLLQMVKDANALSGAEGQAAREADGWENVLGNLKEAWRQLLAVVGQPVLYVATAAVKQLTAALTYLTEKAQMAVSALSQLFGVEFGNTAAVADNISQAVDNQNALTDAVKETEKAQKGSLAAFDQLNTISSNNDESAGASSAASAMPQTIKPQVETEDSENKITEFIDRLKSTLSGFTTWLQENFGEKFTEIWNKLKERVGELKAKFAQIFEDIKSLAGPFADWFNTYFTPLLQAAFTLIGDILVGLLGTFIHVFGDIWDIAIFPFLQTYLETGLPMLTEFATEAIKTFDEFYTNIDEVFNKLWDEAAKPVLEWIMDKWQKLMATFKKFWDKYGHPIFEKLRAAINNTKNTFLAAWDNYLKPLFDKFMAKADEIWDEHLQPLVDNLLEFVGEWIQAALDIYNEFISPIVKWMIEEFGPPLMKTFGTIIDIVGSVLGNIIDVASGIIEALTGVVKFVAGVFTGDWERAWDGIKDIFKGTWDAFAGIAKIPLNLLIGELNLFINGLEQIFNKISDFVGDFDIDIPSWVPGIGGKSFHLDIGSIDIPRIPYLAQGTVVPANYGEFLAVLGDNKREAEVVSPVSAMKKAMLEALAEAGGAGPKEVVVYTYLYPNSAAYHREVIKIVNEDARNRGG
ncbi:MAG: hypothetical protein Q4A05_04790 [Ruminococcus sp.]|nr:hypothetical protein [Ruminococcus sp.]